MDGKLGLSHERRYIDCVLRRIFGPKRDEVTGEWRKLHNEMLLDLYSSPSIIRVFMLRRMRWAGHVVRIIDGKARWKGLVGRPRCR
jgi:hypothetical protein